MSVHVSDERKRVTDARRGYRSLKKKMAADGFRGIDMRSPAARALTAWRVELVTDLGGPEQISAQVSTLIEQAARLKLLLDCCDGYLFSLPSIFIRRRKKVIPLVRERLLLAAELRATLSLLGLKKIPKLVSSIDPERMEKILAVESEQEGKDKEVSP
jgi:hypothetical protein